MELGDKVYCIKTMFNEHNQIVNKKNHQYTIIIVDDDVVWITCEKYTMPRNYIGYIYSGLVYNDFSYFNDYFTTDIKKIRKEKLNEICNL